MPAIVTETRPVCTFVGEGGRKRCHETATVSVDGAFLCPTHQGGPYFTQTGHLAVPIYWKRRSA